MTNITGTVTGQHAEPCPKCTGKNGACSLRCPTLNLPQGFSVLPLDEKLGKQIHNAGGRMGPMAEMDMSK